VRVYVEVELLDAGVVAWSGRVGPLEMGAGTVTEPTPVEVYPGPLDNLGVLSVTIEIPTDPFQMLVEGTVSLSAVYEVSELFLDPVIIWTSSDPSVASVDVEGVVTGVAAGQAEIVAAAGPAADTLSVEVLASAPDREWVGGVSGAETDWNEPGNWNPEGVPTVFGGALIPASTEFIPVLTADAPVGDLTVEAGTELDLAGFGLTVTGDLQADGLVDSQGGGELFLTGSGTTLAARIGDSDFPLRRMVVEAGAEVTVVGRTDVYADIDVPGHLDLGSDTLNAQSNFSTTGVGGSLQMTSASAHLRVSGGASFAGGSTLGLLTAGTVELRGSLSVDESNDDFALYAEGEHLIRFTNSLAAQILMDPSGGTSAVNDVEFASSAVVDIQGAALILGTVTVLPGAPISLETGAEILVGERMDQQGTVTLTGEAALSVTGDLEHSGDLDVGASATVTVGNTLTTATGSTVVLDGTVSTLVCLDRGGTLTLNGTLDCLVQVDSPTHTWSGAVSNDWTTAGNWEEGIVPGVEEHAWIPDGTPNSPLVSEALASLSRLDVHPHTSVELVSGAVLRVLSHVQAGFGDNGGLTGAGTLQSAGGTLAGSLSNLEVDGTVALADLVFASGSVTIPPDRSLDLADYAMFVSGDFTVETSTFQRDHLILGQGAGSLQVDGTFTVGGQTRLEGGSVSIRGDFVQQGFDTAMSPTGTVFYLGNDQGIQQSIAFEDPGRSLSRFSDVWIFEGADLLLGSEVYLTGTLFSSSSEPTTTAIRNPTDSVEREIIVAGLQVDGLTSDGVHVVLDTTDPNSPVAFDNVVYDGFTLDDTHIQLSIRHRGDGGPFTLSNVQFAPLNPDARGYYLELLDTDESEPFLDVTIGPDPGDENTKSGDAGTWLVSEVENVRWQ
ncbi:MAG: Ig-like domain-containing protein, partial [Gemmatimonadota bacterium]